MKIDFDCHVHTTRSACGEDITDDWLCHRAAENSLRFTVTDHTMHLYYEPEIAWAISRDDGIQLFEERRESGRERIYRYLEDIRSCGRPNMMVGVELDVLPDGQIMFADDLRPELDIMVGALHFMPTLKHKAPVEEAMAEFRRQTVWLLEYGLEVLAHPFRILLNAGHEVDAELMEWTVDQAAKHGAAVEINSHKPYPEHDLAMMKLALQKGVKLAIGSDAHNSREFGEFGYHRELLKQAGLTGKEAEERLFVLKAKD